MKHTILHITKQGAEVVKQVPTGLYDDIDKARLHMKLLTTGHYKGRYVLVPVVGV